MSFEHQGFLSLEMDGFRVAVREQHPTKSWFRLADDLNRLGLDMLNGLETPLADNAKLLIAAFFVRAHKSFQAALILAERGLAGDANAVLRSAVEGAIALHALAADPGFVQTLIGVYRLNQQKLARVVLNLEELLDLRQDILRWVGRDPPVRLWQFIGLWRRHSAHHRRPWPATSGIILQ